MPTSLLLFLASSGTVPSQQHKPVVTVQLTDTEGQNRSLGEQLTGCDTNGDTRSHHHSCDLSLLSPAPPLQDLLPSQLVCWHVGGEDVNQKQIPGAGLVTYFFALSTGMHELLCQHNPIIINVTLSQEDPSPLVASVLFNFSSPLVGIAAVALRTLAQPGSSDPLTTCLLQHEEGCDHQCYRYGWSPQGMSQWPPGVTAFLWEFVFEFWSFYLLI